MSRNILQKLVDKTEKIYKENHQKLHNKFAEKVVNFTYKNKGNFERDFVFESNGKYAEILIKFNSENFFNFDVVFNGVIIEKFNNVNCGERLFFLSCKDENTIKILCNSENENLLNFQLFVKGSVKNQSKTLSKLLFLNDKYYFYNNDILSQSNNIMSNNIYNNVINNDNMVNNIDINYSFENINYLKNEILHIYCSDCLKLKNIGNGIEYNLGYIVDDACIVSSKNAGKNINIFYVKNGDVNVVNYFEDLSILGAKKLDSFSGKNIVKISSIISDEIVNYFLVKNTSDLWYLVEYDFAENQVIKFLPIVKCDDLKIYNSNSGIICVEKSETGIVVKKYNNFSMSKKIFEKEFLNVDDAFYFDGNIYLINRDNIQLVEV